MACSPRASWRPGAASIWPRLEWAWRSKPARRLPDIKTVDAFKRTLLDAKSVAYINPKAGGTTGVFFERLIEKLGIADQVRAKAKLKDGGYVADLVASGEAEIGVHVISEIVPVKGAVLVGPLPAEIQTTTTYVAASNTGDRQCRGRQSPHPIHRRTGVRAGAEGEGHGEAVAPSG